MRRSGPANRQAARYLASPAVVRKASQIRPKSLPWALEAPLPSTPGEKIPETSEIKITLSRQQDFL
jgi:hypothetical protein